MVVWNKLYHRSIFAQLRFAEGKLNEDTLLIAYAYEKADRIANIPDALYLYRKVAGSIVNSKVTLRQQNRPIELFERQTDELGYLSKKFLPRALLFSIFGKIHQAKSDTAQDTRRLSSGTTGCPSRTICLSCQSYEVHFGIPLGCSSTQNRTTVTLSNRLIADIGQFHFRISCFGLTRSRIEQRKTQSIQQSRLTGTGTACNGKDAGIFQRFDCKIDLKLSCQRSKILSAYC